MGACSLCREWFERGQKLVTLESRVAKWLDYRVNHGKIDSTCSREGVEGQREAEIM